MRNKYITGSSLSRSQKYLLKKYTLKKSLIRNSYIVDNDEYFDLLRYKDQSHYLHLYQRKCS